MVYLILAVGCGIVGFLDDPAYYPRPPLVPMPVFIGGLVRGLAKVVFIISLLLFTVSLLFGKHLSDRRS